jgi:hypothetical protein
MIDPHGGHTENPRKTPKDSKRKREEVISIT